MAVDTQVGTLIINKLTKAQYDAITPSETELYLVPDDTDSDLEALSASIASVQNLITVNSGSWDSAAANSHTHTNKAVLDGITAAKTASWDAAKPGTVTSVTVRSGSAYLSGNSTISGSGTALLDLATGPKNAITWVYNNSGSVATSTGVTSAINALVTASGSAWTADTDRYVATASFASTGSNGANGVKMTLTRRGSDTGTVVSTIPVASTTAAGVMTGAQVTNLNSAVASASVAKTAMDWITANSASATSTVAKMIAVTASTGTTDRPVAFLSSSNSGSNYVYYNPDFIFNPSTGSIYVKNKGFISLGSASIAKPAGLGFQQTCATTSLQVGIGTGGINKGFYQTAGATALTASNPGIKEAGWLLQFNGTLTASFALGHRVSASGFIGPLQGNATSATRLLAASGSTRQPIYLSGSGVPKACTGYTVTAAETASWIASGALAKTAIQPAATASWAAASTWVSANSGNITNITKSAGDAGTPVYIDANSTPVTCSPNIVGLPMTGSMLEGTSFTLKPGVFDLLMATSNVTINLDVTSSLYGHCPIYACALSLGSQYTVTFNPPTQNDAFAVMKGSADFSEPGTYEINIIKYYTYEDAQYGSSTLYGLIISKVESYI